MAAPFQIVLTEEDARRLQAWFVENSAGEELPFPVRSAVLSIVAQLRNLDGRRHAIPFVDPRR